MTREQAIETVRAELATLDRYTRNMEAIDVPDTSTTIDNYRWERGLIASLYPRLTRAAEEIEL